MGIRSTTGHPPLPLLAMVFSAALITLGLGGTPLRVPIEWGAAWKAALLLPPVVSVVVFYLARFRRRSHICVEVKASRVASIEQLLSDTRALELLARKLSSRGRFRVEFDPISNSFRIALNAKDVKAHDIARIIESSTETLIVTPCSNVEACFVRKGDLTCEELEKVCGGFDVVVAKMGVSKGEFEDCGYMIVDVSTIVLLAEKEEHLAERLGTLAKPYCLVLDSIPAAFTLDRLLRICRNLKPAKCILVLDMYPDKDKTIDIPACKR